MGGDKNNRDVFDQNIRNYSAANPEIQSPYVFSGPGEWRFKTYGLTSQFIPPPFFRRTLHWNRSEPKQVPPKNAKSEPLVSEQIKYTINPGKNKPVNTR
jgi:hypothetical protein